MTGDPAGWPVRIKARSPALGFFIPIGDIAAQDARMAPADLRLLVEFDGDADRALRDLQLVLGGAPAPFQIADEVSVHAQFVRRAERPAGVLYTLAICPTWPVEQDVLEGLGLEVRP